MGIWVGSFGFLATMPPVLLHFASYKSIKGVLPTWSLSIECIPLFITNPSKVRIQGLGLRWFQVPLCEN